MPALGSLLSAEPALSQHPGSSPADASPLQDFSVPRPLGFLLVIS